MELTFIFVLQKQQFKCEVLYILPYFVWGSAVTIRVGGRAVGFYTTHIYIQFDAMGGHKLCPEQTRVLGLEKRFRTRRLHHIYTLSCHTCVASEGPILRGEAVTFTRATILGFYLGVNTAQYTAGVKSPWVYLTLLFPVSSLENLASGTECECITGSTWAQCSPCSPNLNFTYCDLNTVAILISASKQGTLNSRGGN